jgi:AbrB family looped-hinge helix DNA binding protein
VQTKISTKGQVVLPHPLRRKLGLRPGDPLDAKIQRGSIVLTPRRARARKAKIVVDPLTGLLVLTVGDDAAPLSSKQVEELLASFP